MSSTNSPKLPKDLPRARHMLYTLDAIAFQREPNGPWEPGLRLNEGDLIIDEWGQVPDKLWDYHPLLSELSLNIGSIFDSIRRRHATAVLEPPTFVFESDLPVGSGGSGTHRRGNNGGKGTTKPQPSESMKGGESNA